MWLRKRRIERDRLAKNFFRSPGLASRREQFAQCREFMSFRAFLRTLFEEAECLGLLTVFFQVVRQD